MDITRGNPVGGYPPNEGGVGDFSYRTQPGSSGPGASGGASRYGTQDGYDAPADFRGPDYGTSSAPYPAAAPSPEAYPGYPGYSGYSGFPGQPLPGPPAVAMVPRSAMAGHPAAFGPAPYGCDPVTGIPYSDKSKVAAGLLQLFLGEFGVGRFYIGDNKTGGIQLALFLGGVLTSWIVIGIIPLMIVAIWALIDGILMLTGSVRDPYGRPLR